MTDVPSLCPPECLEEELVGGEVAVVRLAVLQVHVVEFVLLT